MIMSKMGSPLIGIMFVRDRTAPKIPRAGLATLGPTSRKLGKLLDIGIVAAFIHYV